MIPVDRLNAIPLFGGVSPELRQRFSEHFREESVEAGRTIFAEGGPGDAMFFVAEGRVSIQKTLDREKKTFKTLAVMQDGDFFGEMALLEREPRSATAVAVVPTKLLVLPVEEVRQWLAGDARIPLRLFLPFLEALSVRLRETTREMALFFDVGRALVQDPDSQRLAAEVLEAVVRAFDDPVTAGFWLWNEFTNDYEMVAGVGSWVEAHRGSRSAGDPLFTWLTEKGECALSADWEKDDRFASARSAWPTAKSVLATPVPGDKRPAGFMVLSHDVLGGYFTPSHRRMLAGVANLVGPAFSNAYFRLEKRAQERLERARQEYR